MKVLVKSAWMDRIDRMFDFDLGRKSDGYA